jgi:multisubunit Na+/H+ antiporter MnhB subunit
MEIAVIARALFLIITVSLVLYALSTKPKKTNFKTTWESVKKNIFKILTVCLVLYSLYLNLLYFNVSKSSRKTHQEYMQTLMLLDSTKVVNTRLVEKIDSLKGYQN